MHSHLSLVGQGLVCDLPLELARACHCNIFICNAMVGCGNADRSLVKINLGVGFVVLGVVIGHCLCGPRHGGPSAS